MTGLEFTVHGMPAAQGSKRHVGNGIMVESSRKVAPWRQDVVAAAVEAMGEDWTPIDGPCFVWVTFYLPRRRSDFRKDGSLKPNAAKFVATRPDCDKLTRSTFDALTTAGVWRDDALAVRVTAEKVYHDNPGAAVLIQAVAE